MNAVTVTSIGAVMWMDRRALVSFTLVCKAIACCSRSAIRSWESCGTFAMGRNYRRYGEELLDQLDAFHIFHLGIAGGDHLFALLKAILHLDEAIVAAADADIAAVGILAVFSQHEYPVAAGVLNKTTQR